MRLSRSLLAVLTSLALLVAACSGDEPGTTAADDQVAGGTEADAAGDGGGPSVAFVSPTDGETITADNAEVEMAAENFEIAPADEGVKEGSGHFHIMVDTECVPEGETIPDDNSHLHFGDGSTTTPLSLPPGEHTLCLQVGDAEHTALPYTDQITVTVE